MASSQPVTSIHDMFYVSCGLCFLDATSVSEATVTWCIMRIIFRCICVLPCLALSSYNPSKKRNSSFFSSNGRWHSFRCCQRIIQSFWCVMTDGVAGWLGFLCFSWLIQWKFSLRFLRKAKTSVPQFHLFPFAVVLTRIKHFPSPLFHCCLLQETLKKRTLSAGRCDCETQCYRLNTVL